MFASFAVCPRRRRATERVGARRRVSSRFGAGCVVNSVPLGTAFRACRVCLVCGAVPWGLLGLLRAVPWGLLVGMSRGWRCVLGIADQGVV